MTNREIDRIVKISDQVAITLNGNGFVLSITLNDLYKVFKAMGNTKTKEDRQQQRDLDAIELESMMDR